MTRVTRLDGLRAVAVLAVIWEHMGPPALADRVALGGLAVRLFFVLSGFLITGILLDARDAAPPSTVLRSFYLRRVLRIVPAYVLMLAAGVMLASEVRRDWLWHALYLSNVKLALDARWPGPASHLWSLSVEEQFYLLWPALLLFLPRRVLPTVMLVLATLAPLVRATVVLVWDNTFAALYLLPGSLDTLALGGWLAWYRRHSEQALPGWWAPVGGAVLLANVTAEWFGVGRLGRIALADSGSALLFAALIDHVRRGGRGTGWLAARPLVFVGTVSYGVYLFHNFVPYLLAKVRPEWAGWIAERGVGPWVVTSCLGVVLASLSWFAIERPVNALKRHVPYSAPAG